MRSSAAVCSAVRFLINATSHAQAASGQMAGQDVQDSVLQWPSDWVASKLRWGGPSASHPSIWTGPSSAIAGGEAGTSSNGGATWNGIFSSSSSGPQGTQVLNADQVPPVSHNLARTSLCTAALPNIKYLGETNMRA